jgi:hypothetical protein
VALLSFLCSVLQTSVSCIIHGTGMRIVSRVISPLSRRVSPLHQPLIFVMDAGVFMNFRLQTLDSIHASNKLHLAWESVRRLKSLRSFSVVFKHPDDFAQCHPRLDLRDRLQLFLAAARCGEVGNGTLALEASSLPIADEVAQGDPQGL